MDFISVLKTSVKAAQKNETNDSETKAQNLKAECEHFLKIYENGTSQNKKTTDSSYCQIPKFYFKIPRDDETILQKLREEARRYFLKRRGLQILDYNELKMLWNFLDEQQTSSRSAYTPPPSVSTVQSLSEEQTINYKDLQAILQRAGPRYKKYLSPLVFAKLQQPHSGRVSIVSLFNYVMRKTWLDQTRIGLSLYDVTGQGYLRESDLENYILELIPTLPQLDGLEKSFHSFYMCTVVRKFIFFLDPLRIGRVKIKDILACSFLDNLLELRDEDLPKDLQEANWFSAPSALHVYGQFLNLDKDRNGMLSKKELAEYNTGKLTTVFLDQVFQKCLTFDGEMDYKTYLDFVLALENRREPQALHYLFRILDINNQGYLDTFCLNYFFRAIQEQMSQHNQEPILFDDIKDELFDMIKPAVPTRITLQDLLNCGQGETVVSILIDLNGFWSYENREAFSAETNDEPQIINK